MSTARCCIPNPFLKLFLIALIFSTNYSGNVMQCEALEATWTPNDQDSNGPLPLSQNQRQQLLQLEKTITSSPDPDGTLRHIAEQNQMSPEDLVSMLQQNRRDLESASGQATASLANRASSTLPRKMLNLIYAFFAMLARYAMINPKGFTVLLLTISLFGYGAITAPRTGIVLSKSTSLISNGHTTLFSPPAQYIHNYLSNHVKGKRKESSISKIGLSRGRKDVLLDIFENSDEDEDLYKTYFEDGIQTYKTGRKSTHDTFKSMQFAVTSRKTVPLGSLAMTEFDEDGDDEALMNTIADITYTSGQNVLSSRRFAEFTSNLRFHSQSNSSSSSSKKRLSCLVMKKLGNWNRFGISPLGLAQEETVSLTSADMCEVAFHTLKGGHFDGELLVAVEKWKRDSMDEKDGIDKQGDFDDSDSEGDYTQSGKDVNVVVSVSLFIPKKGRKPSKKIAERIVSSLSDSITASIMTESKKTISRKIQLGTIQKKTQKHAKARRKERTENEKKIEEMAKDRKRRWQRSTSDGRYRPSRDRMKSPNNC